MTINDAYIAGFFDGEGSATIITVRLKKPNGKFTFQLRPYLKLSQKTRAVLDTITEYLGYGYVTGNSNMGYRWDIADRKHLLDLISRLLPYCVVKHENLLILQEFIDALSSRSTNSIPLTRTQVEYLLGIRDKLLHLNATTRIKQERRIVYTNQYILNHLFFIEESELPEWKNKRAIKLRAAHKSYWDTRRNDLLKTPLELVLCACGCGTHIPKYDAKHRMHRFKNGHFHPKGRRKEMPGVIPVG